MKLNYKSILALFFIIQTQAQVSFKPGLRTGFGFSTISETHSTYKKDFYIGGFGEIKLGRYYALQPEITYSRQGSDNVVRNYNDPNSGTEKFNKESLRLDYLSFTLLNKFTFGSGIQIQFGPSADFLVNHNLVKRKDANDLAFVTGIGYRLPSGLTFEARFKKGFYDILDSDYYYNNSNNNYLFGDYNTNINFQLGVSYSFGK
jgi:hypothetical protein